MKVKCFDVCQEEATTAIYLGDHWPDGRPRYVPSCAGHVAGVISYQGTFEIWAISYPIESVPYVGTCAACWRSHGCSHPWDHEGGHQCGSDDFCGDTPRPDDDVFDFASFQPCTRTGGVRPMWVEVPG